MIYIYGLGFVFIINSVVYEKKETPPSLVFLFSSIYALLRPVFSAFVVDEFPNFLEPPLRFSPKKVLIVPPLFATNTTATRFKANRISPK